MDFLFKQKTAYEMRISDCSSDVFSSDLSIDEEGIRPFIASFSDLSPKAPKEGGVVPLIAQGQADASISTPHHVTAQFVFVNGTLAIEPTNFTEVLVPVKIGSASCRERVCK